MTRIINLKTREPYDVYIGRGSIWGNPYTHIKDRETKALYVVGTRKEALAKYKEYLLASPILMEKIEELRGKTLACYCHPKSCHGDIIIEILSRKPLF